MDRAPPWASVFLLQNGCHSGCCVLKSPSSRCHHHPTSQTPFHRDAASSALNRATGTQFPHCYGGVSDIDQVSQHVLSLPGAWRTWSVLSPKEGPQTTAVQVADPGDLSKAIDGPLFPALSETS